MSLGWWVSLWCRPHRVHTLGEALSAHLLHQLRQQLPERKKQVPACLIQLLGLLHTAIMVYQLRLCCCTHSPPTPPLSAEQGPLLQMQLPAGNLQLQALKHSLFLKVLHVLDLDNREANHVSMGGGWPHQMSGGPECPQVMKQTWANFREWICQPPFPTANAHWDELCLPPQDFSQSVLKSQDLFLTCFDMLNSHFPHTHFLAIFITSNN